jgi:hypothetical protein
VMSWLICFSRLGIGWWTLLAVTDFGLVSD